MCVHNMCAFGSPGPEKKKKKCHDEDARRQPTAGPKDCATRNAWISSSS
jgi:hypothetical protein